MNNTTKNKSISKPKQNNLTQQTDKKTINYSNKLNNYDNYNTNNYQPKLYNNPPNLRDELDQTLQSLDNDVTISLEQTNPATQYRQLKSNYKLTQDNIKEIYNNLNLILKIMMPILKKMSLHEYPCEASKYLTDNICALSQKFRPENLENLFNPANFQQLAQKTLSNTMDLAGKIQKNTMVPDYGKQLTKVIDNTSTMSNQLNQANQNLSKKSIVQKGGMNDMYDYIINPYTNRKVNVKTKLGRNIILNYINSNFSI